ncbi:MAG TPA: M23 family metallopeptidase [Actinomycetota bacterium]|nr:M23 family metallopeptidase [Actinomycetota bacterium]
MSHLSRRFWPSCVVLVALLAALTSPAPALAAGGMRVPSRGTIGSTGLFLSCRSTSSSVSTTRYYDQRNRLRTWDCGPGRRAHKGVDILGSRTPGVTPVVAAAPGVVWSAERGNGMGWRVVLRHARNTGGNGLYTYTIYGHMGDCASGRSLIARGITPGTTVSAGRLLGYQGDDSYPSGCAGRSHVHWEVRAYPSSVSNVFLATPASPDFYTGLQLTNGDPAPVRSV